MAGTFEMAADPLRRREADHGYTVGWKIKQGFERGRLDGEMTYGEARRKAAELQALHPDRTYWPEMLLR